MAGSKTRVESFSDHRHIRRLPRQNDRNRRSAFGPNVLEGPEGLPEIFNQFEFSCGELLPKSAAGNSIARSAAQWAGVAAKSRSPDRGKQKVYRCDFRVDKQPRVAIVLEGFRGRSVGTAFTRERSTGSDAPLRRERASIFDNRLNVPVVNRADLGSSSSDLTRMGRPVFERRRPVTRPCRVTHQVSNESLILAQNQRWRRA